MKILFVCHMGKVRSACASELYSTEYETRHAGVYGLYNDKLLEDVSWADVIVSMDLQVAKALAKIVPKHMPEKVCATVNVPDRFMLKTSSELEKLVRSQCDVIFKQVRELKHN